MSIEIDNILSDFMIGDKKLSIIEQGSEVFIELEVEDAVHKCVSMDRGKWKYFCDHLEKIKLAVKNYLIRAREGTYALHLGKNLFVTVTHGVPCIDFRKWYLPKDGGFLKPSLNGVALKLDEFEALVETLIDINDDIPYLDSVIPCQYSHQNELNCQHCTQSAPMN